MRYGFLSLLICLLPACATMAPPPMTDSPTALIIAHRGASSEVPEHTLEAYQRAIDQGADYIEPDLVMTRDGVLVARHENEISGTTNVADIPEFADRRTVKTIRGRQVTGWFTEDFTLAELRTLRARERIPQLRPASAEQDGRYAIPTLAEIIALVQQQGRSVGLMPEIKFPSYFTSIDLGMEEPLARQLGEAGYDSATDPVMIQSFEIGPLAALDVLTNLRLVQLIGPRGAPADAPDTSYAHMATPAGLQTIATYADAVAPHKSLIMGRNGDGELEAPSTLVSDAQAAGLLVIAYTFRPENYFLPATLRTQRSGSERSHGDMAGEVAAFLAAGIDGLFTDYVPPAIAARDGQASE